MLRSVTNLVNHTIEATDGKVGTVAEFYFDDEKWTIRYLIADTGGWPTGRKVLISPAALGDTRNWWSGKKVLVSPEWIKDINWADSTVHVELSRDAIKNGPEYDESKINRDYEKRLYEHYGRPEYWDH